MASLTIKHDVQRRKDGSVILVKAKRNTEVEVVAVYSDGSVRTKSGDVWYAKKLDNGNFETTVPAN